MYFKKTINKKLKKMKWGFDALMAIICIEENRLIFGKKIESFLRNKLSIFLSYIKSLFSNQFCGIFCCFFIILLSLYKRSTVDIGQDSALYLEKMPHNRC